mmetsp:Transcript_15559/g.32480  ORF Transcript_15559/g.32480 Transcript_15559/m.32480 type:complete len:341 (-) Transcript_15559:17-1039(-)
MHSMIVSGTSRTTTPTPTRRDRAVKVVFVIGFLALFINLAWDPDDFRGYHSPSPTTLSRNPPLYENRQLSNQENNNNTKPFRLGNFYLHISKTGGWNVYQKMFALEESQRQEEEESRICEIAQGSLKRRKLSCDFVFSERRYSKYANRAYAVVRNPRDHVLSQYFHCTESRDHRNNAHFMPSSLDEWLEAWTLALDNETKAEENKQFHCYDPRNYQTSWVYNELKEDESEDLETLKHRFAVIAPFDRMDTAICTIYIQFSGRVPAECICSSKETERKLIHDKHDATHGVKHHGSSYNTTSEQDALIEKLTTDDALLYNRTVELFKGTLKKTEEEYGVKIC